ncbi:hypothetical protein HanIR_Chr01g0036271 [Helianthus annuus]|nr:hypothetical protein HanIR_Chr01g0036271 [Helianthus annuus]
MYSHMNSPNLVHVAPIFSAIAISARSDPWGPHVSLLVASRTWKNVIKKINK